MQLLARALATGAATLMLLTHPQPPAAAVPPPSAEAQAGLRRGYQAFAAGLLPSADSLLSASITEWQRSGQPPDETSALFKTRAAVRQQQGRLQDAVSDLNEAVRLIQMADSRPDAAEVQRTYALRARVNEELQRWKEAEADLSVAIARLDDLAAIEATNPYLYSERSDCRARLGDFAGAADDAVEAAAQFQLIGDKVRRLLATADGALALYGAGDVDLAVQQMKLTFGSKGARSPATNNPDDIGNLQELSRREAELHLAYAAHLYGLEGRTAAQRAEAISQWETGCVRLEAYVTDSLQRASEESKLQAAERQQAEAQGRSGPALRASSVANSPFNSDAGLARLVTGLPADSPYVTQRPQTGYVWYKIGGEAALERRDSGTALAQVDPGLSCARFRNVEWLRANRPTWPPALVTRLDQFASEVEQGPIVMPKRGTASGTSSSECTVILGRPGVGDAVPCF